jgi:hypothetical protein
MHWRLILRHNFLSLTFNHSYLAGIRSSEMDTKITSVDVGPWKCVCWEIFKERMTFKKKIFVKNKKYERGGRKLNVTLFYGDNSGTVALT